MVNEWAVVAFSVRAFIPGDGVQFFRFTIPIILFGQFSSNQNVLQILWPSEATNDSFFRKDLRL